ncbi:MAG: DUF4832 domain-containing protein [Limisphaerales bacterium]
MKNTWLIAFVVGAILVGCFVKPPKDHTPVKLQYQQAPPDNPLKGFFPFSGDFGDTFPHSMEWAHFPLRELMDGPDSFTFNQAFEPALEEIAGRGHQTVLRVHIDYPGQPSGVPQFLIDGGLKMTGYTDHEGGQSPDYSDEKLITALESFIAAFGKKYDGDPRIGFITIGLLGFWGEWHTFPHEDWFPDEDVENRILKAYNRAFKKTKLMVRRPAADSPNLPIGYHDDSFAFSTLPTVEWHFVSLLRSAGLTNSWHTQPIGGELRPELQTNIWMRPIPAEPKAEDFTECVRLTHASFLTTHRIFSTPLPDEDRQRALEAAHSLGYEIHIAEVTIPEIRSGDPIEIILQVENRGVAPFYYDWEVQLEINGEIAKTDIRLSKVLPGNPALWRPSIKLQIPAGEHAVRMRVVNPMEGGKQFRFANEEQKSDGWLELGTLTVM